MASAETTRFPWYSVVEGTELSQGDILLGCRRPIIPAVASDTSDPFALQFETVDAVVLTQSCDLVIREDGSCEASDVLLCVAHPKRRLDNHRIFSRDDKWEEARKGRMSYFHVLNECLEPGLELDFMLVDFHWLFTLSIDVVRQQARVAGCRLRLQPPYREHLSQAFARHFMRVGLPSDIAPFGKRK